MNEYTYTFEDQQSMSMGVSVNSDIRQILLDNIPGSLNAYQAALENDRSGIDWWVELQGKHLAVDVKVRAEDWAKNHPEEDDLALESWSVVNHKIGWTRDQFKKCDYVLWVWKETGRYCLIPFPMLCKVFSRRWLEWRSKYKTRQQRTTGLGSNYKSECVFVPRREVWAEIYRTYSGQCSPVTDPSNQPIDAATVKQSLIVAGSN